MSNHKWFRPVLWSWILAFVSLTSRGQAQDNPPTQATEPAKTGESGNIVPGQPNVAKPKAETPFNQAMELYHEHELPKAMAKFKEAAGEGGPDAAASYAWLCRLQLMVRLPEEAAASANKALELNKELPTAQSAMGEVLYRQGRFVEAQEIFRRIVVADKPDARAYLGLAKIHWANGNYKSAKQVIDHAFNLDHQDPEIFRRWLLTLDDQEQVTAMQSQLALVSSPDAPETKDLKVLIQAREERQKKPLGGCKLVSAASSTEMKMEMLLRGPKQLGGYAIPIKLNDAKATVQVDTGAGGFIVNSRVAQKAGLQKLSALRVGGIGDDGPAQGYSAYADTITVGDLQFKNCYVQVVEHLRVADEDGLIGTNIFEDFLVDLDFPDKKLRLSPLEPLPDTSLGELSLHSEMPIKPNPHNRMVPEKYASFEKVYRVGRDLLIPTQINDSLPRLFLLDTGGWDNMITPALAREISKVSESGMKVSGLAGGVRNVYQTDELTLTFGGFQQHRQKLLAFDLKRMSDDAGTEISGILGFAMLWILEIKLDYRDHLVDFQVDPNRPH